MEIFWCGIGPWLARPDALRRFCEWAGIAAGDFLCPEDLAAHAAGRYLLFRGFQRYSPNRLPLPLEYGPGGKPRFPGGRPAFNISHSGNIAACAFSRWEIGLDVEEEAPLDGSLPALLQPEELAYLQRCPEERQISIFYQLWTRKESLLKAQGGVLADVLEQESLVTPEGQWKDRLGGFFLREVPFPQPGYRMAVCTRERETAALTRLELPEEMDQPPGPLQPERE